MNQLKAPIHNLEAEQAVLGAILLNPTVLTTCKETLQVEDFYPEGHKRIYQAMLTAEIIDIINLCAADPKIDNNYLAKIADETSTSAGVAYHAGIIKTLSRMRKGKNICETALDMIEKGESPETIEQYIRDSLTALDTGKQSRQGVDVDNIYDADRMLETYSEYIETLKHNRFLTGISEIDKRIRGVAGGEVLTIIARAGSFKTALLQNLLLNYTHNSAWAALFFSIEMPITSVTERYHQITYDSDGKWIEEHYTSNQADVESYRKELESNFRKELKNLYVVPTKVSIPEMASYIRLTEKHFKCKVGVVGIDYLGLIDGPGKGEYEIISTLSRDIKDFAKAVNLPVVLLSQVSRKGGTGEDEVSLDMGRGSGAIEEGADFLLGLWQVEKKYGMTEDRPEEAEYDLICRILKNRKGSKGSRWKLQVDPKTLKIGKDAEKYESPKKREYKERKDIDY